MKYTGLNPTDVNKVASGSLGVFVESTQVGTFGTNSLVVSGSTTLSGSLTNIGPQIQSGSLTIVGNTTITGSLTVVTGSSIELQVTDTGVRLGNAAGDSHTITGSLGTTGSVNIQGNTGINGTLSITGSQYNSGSTDVTTIQGSTAGGQLFNVLGTAGQLFSVTDGLSGSLFSVNTISGLPLMEIFSDETINIGRFGVNPLKTSGSVAIVTGSFTGSVSGQAIGPFVATGSSNVFSVQGTGLEATIFDVNGPSGQLFSVVDGLSGSLFSVNTISGVPVMEVFSDNTIRLGQYSAPPLIISSSNVIVSGSSTAPAVLSIQTGSLTISRSGSGLSDPLFDVEGAQGQLFSVIDSFSGSLMSVNDISGFPILDVRSDDSVIMGTYGSNALVVSGSSVIIGVTGSAAPTTTGSNGQIQFSVIGGNAFIYVWLGGRWRSGSLA
jgi:hypothetical protein